MSMHGTQRALHSCRTVLGETSLLITWRVNNDLNVFTLDTVEGLTCFVVCLAYYEAFCNSSRFSVGRAESEETLPSFLPTFPPRWRLGRAPGCCRPCCGGQHYSSEDLAFQILKPKSVSHTWSHFLHTLQVLGWGWKNSLELAQELALRTLCILWCQEELFKKVPTELTAYMGFPVLQLRREKEKNFSVIVGEMTYSGFSLPAGIRFREKPVDPKSKDTESLI